MWYQTGTAGGTEPALYVLDHVVFVPFSMFLVLLARSAVWQAQRIAVVLHALSTGPISWK